MGALTSRQNAGVEEVDIPSNSVYRYPPKSGSYFANHFIMGGEKFDSTHPEGYLFGENTDLNFLGIRPVAFPYAAPPPQEPVKTLRSLINIRKDTLRLVRCSEDLKPPGENVAGKSKACYNIEFTFDADTQVAITIYYQAIEEFHNGVPIALQLEAEQLPYQPFVGDVDTKELEALNLLHYSPVDVNGDVFGTPFPVVHDQLLCLAHVEGEVVVLAAVSSLSVIRPHHCCVVGRLNDGVGIVSRHTVMGEQGVQKGTEHAPLRRTHVEDQRGRCVVAYPYHLGAARQEVQDPPNCYPICRLSFRALLQIRAMRKKLSPLSPAGFNPVITSQTSDSEEHSASDHIPPGYEAVSLLEALNGPLSVSPSAPPLQELSGGHVSGTLPHYSSEPHPAPARSMSPLDHSNSSQGLKLKKSGSKSLSQNSSVLPEEEDEKSERSESEVQACRRKQQPESGVTPESENLTLSSSGAIDQSSCTGTPFSSTITSPEDQVSSSLAQSVMSMASSHSHHSQISTDTLSSMSGSYLAGPEGEENQDAPMESRGPSQQDGEELPMEPKEQNFSVAVSDEQDSEVHI
ncbi:unnamed protein product [Oncorhynchus mykiss]|uniref:E3 ubiquitin-protein ligase n=1 Tax=Oncorhynchus mykiss TaxID=8022 RepID=A0A060X9L8_ONCMY|nr:unnamed protein product [Oncorhynchus mykiss]